MKKLLTLTIGVLALVTLTGLSTAQEEKKAPDPAPPDQIKLTKKQTELSNKPCFATAQPYFTGNSAHIYPNRDVTFVPATAVLYPPSNQWKTDPTGKLTVKIKSGVTVTAKMQSGTVTLTSNTVACLWNDPSS